ncbi:MAG: tetratricopeptide repeat protein [Planctomycetota bacterium]
MLRAIDPTNSLVPLTIALFVGGLLSACQASDPSENAESRTVTAVLPGDPQEAARWFTLGCEQIRDNDMDQASQCFQRALAEDPTHGPSHNNLGKIQFNRGEFQAAALSFQAANKSMPYRPEPLNNLGLVLESGNRLEAAAERFEAAANLAPNEPEYIANWARVRVRLGGQDQVLRRDLAHIARHDPRERWAQWAEAELRRIESASLEP